MPPDFNEITNETSPSDISSMIGAELFSKEALTSEEDSSESSEVTPGLESDIPVSPDEISLDEPTPAPVFSGKALPKAWKKDMEPVWQKLDPAVHDYVYEREANVMRGLQQYQSGHEQWNQVIQPFRHVMEQHPDVNPTELLTNLMTNHLAVVQAPKSERVRLVRNIIQGYGLDLSEFIGDTSNPGTPIPPEVEQLRGELGQIKAHLIQNQQTAYQRAVDAETVKVNAFFSDPKNEHASELSDDILRLLKTGSVDSLDAAYEQACWINPVVRQKLLAKQRAEAVGEVTAKPKPTNIDSTGSVRTRNKVPRSWQDGVDSIITKHFGSN